MLKDSKNLLKMSLKILFIKRKKGKFLSFLPSSHSARWPLSFFFPRPSTAASSPARLPLFPARPSSRQPPNRAGPAARTVPAQPRRTRQLPRPAADARVPPVGAVPYPARLGNRPLLALQQPPPRRASWARPPVALGLVKRQPSPPSRAPCCPRSVFASSRPQLPHGGAPPTTDLAVRVAVVSEPSPPPIFARGELAVVPSPSPCVSIRVSWLLAPVPHAFASFMPPTMAPVASASSSGRRDGLREFPFSPAFSRCLRISEPWPLAPEPRAPACPCRWSWLRRRGCHCAGRRHPFLSPSHLF